MALKPKSPPLTIVVWANIQKWMMIREVEDSEIAAILGVKRLDTRIRNKVLAVSEMDSIAQYLAIEPEKLLER